MPATDRKSQFTPMSCSNPELAGIKSASAQNLNKIKYQYYCSLFSETAVLELQVQW